METRRGWPWQARPWRFYSLCHARTCADL